MVTAGLFVGTSVVTFFMGWRAGVGGPCGMLVSVSPCAFVGPIGWLFSPSLMVIDGIGCQAMMSAISPGSVVVGVGEAGGGVGDRRWVCDLCRS